MGFRFPLATVLRLREISEQREERLLTQIFNQIAQSRQTLADLQRQRQTLTAQRECSLMQPTSAFHIVDFQAQIRRLDDLEAHGKDHLAQLTVLRAQQMEIYEAVHRSHELLSDMKATQINSFNRERTRQEQNAVDDNFSKRRSISRQHLPGK